MNLFLMVVCAYLFYQFGKMEGSRDRGSIWVLFSLAIWLGSVNFIARSLVVALLGQVALFIGIGVYRAMNS